MGEGGERLSGGQAQRVALARAFLKDAPVLVLDEPTAQLDPESEAAVVEAMDGLRRGRTVLLVAHRLTTVARADRVALVARGRVVEEGPPAAARRERVAPTRGSSPPGRARREGRWRRLVSLLAPERGRAAARRRCCRS